MSCVLISTINTLYNSLFFVCVEDTKTFWEWQAKLAKTNVYIPCHTCSHLLPSQSITGQCQCDLSEWQLGVVNFRTIKRITVCKSYASKENSYFKCHTEHYKTTTVIHLPTTGEFGKIEYSWGNRDHEALPEVSERTSSSARIKDGSSRAGKQLVS